MEKPRGALVAKVLEGSPAEQAGFKAGDIVLEFDRARVQRSSDLPPIVGRTKVDALTPVQVLRNGERVTLEVKIGELPEQGQALAAGEGPSSTTTAAARLGLAVKDLSAEERAASEVEAGGVIVTEVAEGPGRAAGLRPGDVVLMLNGENVQGAEQFQELTKALPIGKPVSVLVQREKSPIFLALKTEK
jgi:serine protease Do